MVLGIIAASILRDLIIRQSGNGNRFRHIGYVQLHRTIVLINRTAGHIFISCRDFISLDANIIPSRIGLTSLDVVSFAINFKAGNIRCIFRCFYGFHFRACREGLRNCLSIRRVGNTDIGVITTCAATISNGQCPIDSRAGRIITVTHEGNSCRRIVRAHIYGLNIVMIERKVIVPQDVEVFLVFGYPVGIHRSASVIDFSAPIAIVFAIRFLDSH